MNIVELNVYFMLNLDFDLGLALVFCCIRLQSDYFHYPNHSPNN